MNPIVYTIADQKNKPFADILEKSFKHFHPDIPFKVYGEDELNASGIERPTIFYLATPLYAQQLFKEYDTVVKMDADSIVLGNLDHIFNDMTYDVGTVYNWNRIDPPKFGEIGLATIQPQEYYNNGFVVMRNKAFVDEWMNLCKTRHFVRMPFREQGFLNILTHYGRHTVKCFDDSDMWHGLRSKGEWNRCVMKDGNVVLPKGADGYPEADKIIKVIHWAGGAGETKMNYRAYFNEEVQDFITEIMK